jgi:hypothetical protein
MAERHCTNCGAELGEETRFCPSCGRPVHETAAVPTPEADVGIPPPPSQQPTAQQGQGYGGAGSTYGAPAPPRRRRTWLWVLIGAGGCLIVILVAVLGFAGCTAALIGGAASGGGEQQSPKEKYSDAKDKAVPVGETVKAGNVAWTVRSVQQSTELKAFGSRKKGNFVIVDVLFKNNGNEAVTLDSSSLVILDDKGRENETDPDASMYVPSNQDLFLNQVNPGVTKSGRAIFNVAPDAEGLILRVGDTNPFGGTNAYVDLGV